MVDVYEGVNNCSKKRRSPSVDITFEVNNDEMSILDSATVEIIEPATKMVKREHEVSVESNPIILPRDNIDFNSSDFREEKIKELQAENLRLQREREDSISRICKCNSNSNATYIEKHLITIKFHHENVAEQYRVLFHNFLKTLNDIKYESTGLEIHISEINPEIGTSTGDSAEGNRKRKRNKSRSTDLFVVDSTPPVLGKDHTELKYVSKYTVQMPGNAPVENTANYNSCFNCNQKHTLRDCPQPKDFGKINAARQKMKSQQITKPRYHLDEDQKFAHFHAGKISHQLKDALGMRKDQLPPYIYKMRQIGYPPGWIEDAKVVHSDMSIFDIEGKEDFKAKKNVFVDIDPNKLVDYPGFNVPLGEGYRDDYKYYNCPPYSEKCSKAAMISYFKQMAAKQKDNLVSTDMDLDQGTDDASLPPGCENEIIEDPRRSPTLTDLEKKKLELLAELDNGSSNSNEDKVADTDCPEKKDAKEETQPDLTEEKTKDHPTVEKDTIMEADTVIEKECIYTQESTVKDGKGENAGNGDEDDKAETTLNECKDLDKTIEHSTPSDNIKLSVFGTPLIKSASPFNRLPESDNFSKDISPVINFENLPNSTGKYEQITSVLQKVRRTLKSLSDKL